MYYRAFAWLAAWLVVSSTFCIAPTSLAQHRHRHRHKHHAIVPDSASMSDTTIVSDIANRSDTTRHAGISDTTKLISPLDTTKMATRTKHGRHRKVAAHTPQIKPDILTLRYKPQAGTLLYNVHTEIGQSVHSDGNDYHGVLRSAAQLAFHNVAIDYKKGVWSFEEYFTKFEITGQELLGDSVSLRESLAVDRVTQLTYDMKGDELDKIIVDTLKLLNAEAQTNAYFFEPPRMLIPLPEHAITYGDVWAEHHTDTIPVRDTVNLGTTTGAYTYDVFWKYHLARLLDTDNRFYAIIVATDSGMFSGFQSNTATKITTRTSGPITGSDTTVLDLFSGCVIKRTLDMTIPAKVTVGSNASLLDKLTVHSIVTLDESNAKVLKEN